MSQIQPSLAAHPQQQQIFASSAGSKRKKPERSQDVAEEEPAITYHVSEEYSSSSSDPPTMHTQVAQDPENTAVEIEHPVVADEYTHDQPGDPLPAIMLKVGTMQTLAPGDYKTCPIAMEDFDKATVDSLKEDACFVEGRPEFCVGKLPCGHRFHAVSILYHMVINGMSCPVCR